MKGDSFAFFCGGYDAEYLSVRASNDLMSLINFSYRVKDDNEHYF